MNKCHDIFLINMIITEPSRCHSPSGLFLKAKVWILFHIYVCWYRSKYHSPVPHLYSIIIWMVQCWVVSAYIFCPCFLRCTGNISGVVKQTKIRKTPIGKMWNQLRIYRKPQVSCIKRSRIVFSLFSFVWVLVLVLKYTHDKGVYVGLSLTVFVVIFLLYKLIII